MVFCKRCYFMANYFNLGCSSALSRMVNRVSAFRGAARPCGVPSKQMGFVKKPVSPDLVTRFGLLKPMWQKTSKSCNQQSSWNWASNTHWLKAKMQIVNLCCWGFFSAFALLFGNRHHLCYLWAVSKNIFRTCLLLRWGCTRLLLNRNKSLLFLCRFFVNLSKPLQSSKSPRPEHLSPAAEIARRLRVLRAWPKRQDVFPGYCIFLLYMLCMVCSDCAVCSL